MRRQTFSRGDTTSRKRSMTLNLSLIFHKDKLRNVESIWTYFYVVVSSSERLRNYILVAYRLSFRHACWACLTLKLRKFLVFTAQQALKLSFKI